MKLAVGADSQINAGSSWDKVQSRNQSRRGRGSYQVPGSRPERRDRLTAGELPRSTMRELFSFEFVWRAGSGFRRMSDERVSLESDTVVSKGQSVPASGAGEAQILVRLRLVPSLKL